jgi:hypothetical protein
MKKKLISFDEYLNENLSAKEQISFQNFNTFISSFIEDPASLIGESVSKDVVLEKYREGKRLVDYLHEKSLFEGLDFETFTEEEKWNLEDCMWEGMIFHMSNSDKLTEEELLEGFWSGIVGGVKSLAEKGKKALDWAMKTLGNIGTLIKSIIEYVKAFFSKVGELALKAGKSALGMVTGKVASKFEKQKARFSKDAVKQESGELKDTVSWLTNAAQDMIDKGAKDGEGAAQEAAGGDKEEKEQLIQGIKDEMIKNVDKKLKENSNLDYRYIHLINEIRKSNEIDFSELVIAAEIAEKSKNLNEGATQEDLLTDDFLVELFGWEKKKEAEAQEPQVDADPHEKTKLLLQKAVKGLGKVVSIIVSGWVYFAEKALEYLLREQAFPMFSGWVAKAGGPGPFKFAITAGVIAIVLAMVVEFGLDIIKSATGTDALDGILHAVHGYNPLHIIEHALHIPGGAVVAKCIAVAWCTWQAYEHVAHMLHGDHGHDDHGH